MGSSPKSARHLAARPPAHRHLLKAQQLAESISLIEKDYVRMVRHQSNQTDRSSPALVLSEIIRLQLLRRRTAIHRASCFPGYETMTDDETHMHTTPSGQAFSAAAWASAGRGLHRATALPSGCVAAGKRHNLSVPQLPHLERES